MASSIVCGLFEKLKKCLKPSRRPLEVDGYSHEFLPPPVSLEAAASPRPCILTLYREQQERPVGVQQQGAVGLQRQGASEGRSFERACVGGASACFQADVLPPTPSTSAGSSSDSLAEPAEDTVRQRCEAVDVEENEEHAFHGNGE